MKKSYVNTFKGVKTRSVPAKIHNRNTFSLVASQCLRLLANAFKISHYEPSLSYYISYFNVLLVSNIKSTTETLWPNVLLDVVLLSVLHQLGIEAVPVNF